MSLVRTLRILASQRPSTPPAPSPRPRACSVRHGHARHLDRQELSGTATIIHLHGGSYAR